MAALVDDGFDNKATSPPPPLDLDKGNARACFRTLKITLHLDTDRIIELLGILLESEFHHVRSLLK